MKTGLFVFLAVGVVAGLSGCCCGGGGGCFGGRPGSGYGEYAACNTGGEMPCDTCGPAGCDTCSQVECQTCARPDPGLGGLVGGLAGGGGQMNTPGPPTGAITYPYYTSRGPRDFLAQNPPSIGP
ncbi:MAG: hypothetical protein A2V70_02310 [Planctomycetes bacterium RBG_13_63_9]|nr:MAG: hypothetical protein A2V70_02310 [Planctomycetes bacterium RBG_13_63_9]